MSSEDYLGVKFAPAFLPVGAVSGVAKLQSRNSTSVGVHVFDIVDNTFCLMIDGVYVKTWLARNDPKGLDSSYYMSERTIINASGALYVRTAGKWIAVGTDSNIKVISQSEFDQLPDSAKDEKTIYMTY